MVAFRGEVDVITGGTDMRWAWMAGLLGAVSLAACSNGDLTRERASELIGQAISSDTVASEHTIGGWALIQGVLTVRVKFEGCPQTIPVSSRYTVGFGLQDLIAANLISEFRLTKSRPEQKVFGGLTGKSYCFYRAALSEKLGAYMLGEREAGESIDIDLLAYKVRMGEVTGITSPDANRREVDFTYSYEPTLVGEVLRPGSPFYRKREPYKGEASFVLYDDGWRLEDVDR